jgi:bidirectional [NiFe] hydrogenase diaphorase subunit
MGKLIDLDAVTDAELTARSRARVRALVCTSTGCLAAGAAPVRDALVADVAAADRGDEVQVVPIGCPGLCSRGPLVQVEARADEPTLYADVDADGARAIARDHLLGGRPAEGVAVVPQDTPFLRSQVKVVLANAGRIDPERIEDYVAHGGYRALERAVTDLTPAEVLATVDASGLRGRGGAGYPTGRKWHLLAAAPGEHKVVIANGDEGDPGAYMDRTIMDSDPHRVLEGLAIAAYATGATEGYLYVRAEYGLAIERLERAIRAAKRGRLLGRGILGSEFSFDVSIRVGAGAFVCGEETALIASIEGRRGSPRLRPPYPTERGVFGLPSMVNNVETLANIPAIITNGADWFRSVGTPESPGTKVFALTGSLTTTGLIEVPMGISLRSIVEDIGGGVADGHSFKAAQTGGPSGGCIPARFLDTPVDYEHLRALGSMMGSGGLVVVDDTVSMPEFARFYLEFCRDESCGKCAPCRSGTVQMVAIVDRICRGEAHRRDLDQLTSLCRTVQATSLCGLGQSAPNPLLSTLEHFRDEYEALLLAEPTPAAAGTGGAS